MNSSEIRQAFLEYFRKRGHTVVPSSSLIPEGDPTLLFTNAGMVQFKGVFLEEEKRDYKRAVSSQKCMRAGGKHNDLENVGRTARHHTFFEMLGNFSFGDYFKEGAIEYAWEFLTREIGLPKERLWVTVFRDDDEASRLWRAKTGIPEERIVRMGEEDNFWSMGDVGPCGPCSEVIIDQGEGTGCGRESCGVGCDCDRYLELWNLVFMQYNRTPDGKVLALPKPSIDTGMGLERLTAVVQGKKSNYDTDLFIPIIQYIEELASTTYGRDTEKDISIRAIADHSRAITFLITDGVFPSNEGRGYVLRRIIRRAVRHGRFLNITEPFLYRLNKRVIEVMGGVYPEIVKAEKTVSRITYGEEERFFVTLERGLALLEEELSALKKEGRKVIPGDVAFKLYDTYGFPVDLTADIVKKDGFSVDEEGFSRYMTQQREIARKSWKGGEYISDVSELYRRLVSDNVRSDFVGYHMEACSSKVLAIIKDNTLADSASKGDKVEIITEKTPFYGESGGQVGDTGVILGESLSVRVTDTQRPMEGLIVHVCVIEEGSLSVGDTVELVPDMERRLSICRNHTATHILHAVLRQTLGEHVRQSGSLVAPDGLRFDFSHFSSLDPETIRSIEERANRVVMDNIEVSTEVLPYREAIERGALAFFGEKYGEVVRLVMIDNVSRELCGGTHVKRTGDIGFIKITSEGSVSAGTRRIEAITGTKALDAITKADSTLRKTAVLLRVPSLEVPEKVEKLLEHQKGLEKEIERLRGITRSELAHRLASLARTINNIKVVTARVELPGTKDMREMADLLRAKLGSGIVVLAGTQDGKVVLLAAVTRDLRERFNAGSIIKRIAPLVDGKGGGKADMAQAGGRKVAGIDDALRRACEVVEEMASG